ncbi:hypothetical protein EVAR_39372_1 [Eumeta japonica]|uniref:Uncharacterized protein n=1 Tax=Eumeta variegata TaxID=151549 RepID=A0A4C1ZCY4_EUMVA|nr:hypothetical protein EVAR_39372_1 [Eumeta japonica]
MTSQTTLIASPSAAGRHAVPTARDMRYMDDAWWKSSRHGMSQKPSRVGSLPCWPEASCVSLTSLAFNCRCKSVRWIGKYVSWRMGGWDAAVDSQPPRRSALGCDPAMSNRFDASFIYLEIVGSSKSLWRIELRHTNVHPLRLYRIYSVLPVVYVVLLERRERRSRRRVCHHRPNAHFVYVPLPRNDRIQHFKIGSVFVDNESTLILPYLNCMAADLSGLLLSSTSGTIDLARQWPSEREEGIGCSFPISVKSAVSSANNASWTPDDGRGTSFVYAGTAERETCVPYPIEGLGYIKEDSYGATFVSKPSETYSTKRRTCCGQEWAGRKPNCSSMMEADRSVAGREERGFPGLWMPITSASFQAGGNMLSVQHTRLETRL